MPIDALLKPAEQRTAMSGTAYVTQTTKEGRSVSAPAVVMVQWPDKARFELQDPVGGTLLLLLVDGDRFWLYQKSRPENLTGPLKSIPTDVKMTGGAQDLVRVLLARPRWEEYRGAAVNEAHELRRKVKFGDETLTYDPRELTPLRWQNQMFDGSRSEISYEEFSSVTGIRYPTKLRIGGYENQRSVLLTWKDWQPSVPANKNSFQIPPERTFNRPTKTLR